MNVGVFALIKDEAGKVLLVQDATRQELWTLPGGGPDFQELMPEALAREVKEETSADVEVGTLLGIFSQRKAPGITILFEAVIVGGELKPDGTETQNVRFFSIAEMLERRSEIKPAQLSMAVQALNASERDIPIFNHFIEPTDISGK